MVPVLIIAGVKLHVILECVAAVEPLGTEVAGEGHLAAVDEVVLLKTGLAIKNPPKKTPKNPLKMFLFLFLYLFLIFL
jgi:hypothetical protein